MADESKHEERKTCVTIGLFMRIPLLSCLSLYGGGEMPFLLCFGMF